MTGSSRFPSSTGATFQVVTSLTRPSTPSDGQVIYETDTGNMLIWNDTASAWRQPWNQPWGIIAYAELTSNSGSFTSSTELITTSTVDVLAGRSYAVSVFARVYQSGASTGAQNIVAYADTTALTSTSDLEAGAAKTVTHTIPDARYNPVSNATIDFSVWGTATSSSLLVCTTTAPSYISVKDVGPAL